VNPNNSIESGGPNDVPENIKGQLPNPTRWGGNDRYQTNIIINENSNLNTSTMYVATGQNYADALTGAVLAAKRNSSILLVHHRVPGSVADYITANKLLRLSIFGGEMAVSASVANDLAGLVK
jgi:putative cell wall-binding protein